MSEALHPGSRFWDRIARRYARQPVADEESYIKKLQITRSYLSPDMEVLEFGCGTGSTALQLAPYVKHIRAIDFSARMIEIARGKAAAQDIGNVTFERAAIEDIESTGGSYDVVMGHSILHLLDNKEAVIAKVHWLLKPGGVFVTSTACLGDLNGLLRGLLALLLPLGRSVGWAPLVTSFTPQQLQESLIAGGFTIDHLWQPTKGKAIFIVAMKPGK